MGQYYAPTIIAEGEEPKTLDSHDFGSGSKLMEHSWVGNDFVNVSYSLIFRSPKRIAWMGDYAMDSYEKCGEPYTKVMPYEEFLSYYNAVWQDEQSDKTCVKKSELPKDGLAALTLDTKDMYLINHTKQTYINLGEYIRDNTLDEDGCINPLPLLTACGNGRGGGDFYQGDNTIGYDSVGTWAFDCLEYTPEIPDGYKATMHHFAES